mmetsp:Transcript_86208/g.222030  ORF Transcript_86208/g.222030 Transcript_86208/m.222030 type:complete len:794 (-) Transcript_86208:390-2771(-)
MGCGKSSAASAGPKPSKQQQKLLDEYVVGKKLGEGAFGVVSLCKHRVTGVQRAVKMVDKVETPLKMIEEETRLMLALDHPNIVKCHGVFYERCFICIVMDLYTGGDMMSGMQNYFRTKGQVECREVTHLSHQMSASIKYCHNKGVMHRDIKGDNYLLDRQDITDKLCKVVLTDFGMACEAGPEDRLSIKCGSEMYWAPEIYAKSYGLKVDVWALGVIMFGLVTARFPFKDEDDIKSKVAKIPKRVHPTCKEFIEVMLDKNEKSRPNSCEVMEHPWVAGSAKSPDTLAHEVNDHVVAQDTSGHDEKHEQGNTLCADDVKADVQERRQELMDRLNMEHERRIPASGAKAGETRSRTVYSSNHLAKKFTVAGRRSPKQALVYEWWGVEKVREKGLLDMEAKAEPATPEAFEANIDIGVFSQMLTEHNIDTTKFGVGKAKTLAELSEEVRSGTARLMLDATEHKKLVRVVDVVVLRVCPQGQDSFLVETQEVFPDGRTRENNFLPGEKKEPHENTQQAAQRILADFLGMQGHHVQLDLMKIRRIEEERPSPSYPGVTTVYRKEIVNVVLTTTNTAHLLKIGLPSGSSWSKKDASGNTKFFEWMTPKKAKAKNVKLTLGEENISTLVQAPIGLSEEALREHLALHNVASAKYGQEGSKTIKQFSAELISGEATLVKDTRVVDNIIVIISNPRTKEILVQTGQVAPDGTTTPVERLPGFKHRPDENQFTSAKRMCQWRLEIDENQVKLDQKVMMVEGERKIPAYPGLRTIYRRRLIKAELELAVTDSPGNDPSVYKVCV